MISKKRLAKWVLVPAIAGIAVASFVAIGTRPSTQTEASSHREAPLISGDPKADATDTYVFIAPDSPNMATLVGNWVPLEEPAGGPNFYNWGDDVLYSFSIDNNGDGKADLHYDFRFYTEVQDPTTFLYATGPILSLNDPHFNIRQFYDVTFTGPNHEPKSVIATHLAVPPNNIGPVSTPNYDALATAAVYSLPNGGKVFAGQRDDPFFVDLGSLFDLATIRQPPGNNGGGIDNVAGFNVLSIVLQVPITEVTGCHCDSQPQQAAAVTTNKSTNDDGTRTRTDATKTSRTKTPAATRTVVATPTAAPPPPPQSDLVIGVWTDTFRQRVNVFNGDGSQSDSGPNRKVSRLGNPLVNEVVIPLSSKDKFNASYPEDDGQFASFVLNSDLAAKLNAVYNGVIHPIPTGNRTDLVTVFLTGLPGLNQPKNVVPSEELRINLGIKPASCGPVKRLGVIAGDNCGFPNGRRLGDDSTDVELRAVACGYGFNLGPCVDSSPNNKLGDGVDQNDKAFLASFPYVASPFSGFASPHNTTPVPTLASGLGGAAAAIVLLLAGSQIVSRIRRRRGTEVTESR